MELYLPRRVGGRVVRLEARGGLNAFVAHPGAVGGLLLGAALLLGALLLGRLADG